MKNSSIMKLPVNVLILVIVVVNHLKMVMRWVGTKNIVAKQKLQKLLLRLHLLLLLLIALRTKRKKSTTPIQLPDTWAACIEDGMLAKQKRRRINIHLLPLQEILIIDLRYMLQIDTNGMFAKYIFSKF